MHTEERSLLWPGRPLEGRLWRREAGLGGHLRGKILFVVMIHGRNQSLV